MTSLLLYAALLGGAISCHAREVSIEEVDATNWRQASKRALLQRNAEVCDPTAVDAGKVVAACPADAVPDALIPILCYGPCKDGYHKEYDIDGRCRCVPRCPDGWWWWACTVTGGVICRGCKQPFFYNKFTDTCYAPCLPPYAPWGNWYGYTSPPLCCPPCKQGYVPSPSNPSLCMMKLSPSAETDSEIILLRNPLVKPTITLPNFYYWRRCTPRRTLKPTTITIEPYPCPRLWATCTPATPDPTGRN